MALIPRQPGAPVPTPPGKICLLTIDSLLTRIWASVTTGSLGHRNDWCWCHQGIAGKSSTQTAARRDLQRFICEREEIPWGAVSFGMTKCFDSLPRASLVGVALRRGMPCNLAESLLTFLTLVSDTSVIRATSEKP